MTSEAGNSGSGDAHVVRALFPFCFSLSDDLRIVDAGRRWDTFAPAVRVGERFDAVLEIERPAGLRTAQEILARAEDVFIIGLRSNPAFKLRGQFVARDAADGRGAVLFVGGPWVTQIAEIGALGLELADFPPHDPRGDYLILLQTQGTTLAETRELNTRLRTTTTALELRTKEMEREMQLRAELEAQLRQSQKMEAIGRLAGGVAHDFNNILMAVQGYVALSLSRVTPTDPVRAWIEEIRKAADRAANLTRQLLAFSRQQVLRPKALDLAHELREFEKLLRPMLGERVRLSVDAPDGLGAVWADESAVNQIVMNLAVNARDAMPNGGDLEIRLRAIDGVPGSTVRDAGLLEITVRDTGTGMDDATKARAFEPFFTTKEPGKGSGLGLAQVYGLVEQCGGTIELETEVGKGSTFRVLLPRLEGPAVPSERAPAPPAQGGRGERLLLVEDEPLVRKLLEQLMSRAGYQVTSSSDPMAALALAQLDAGIELIVTDVVMAGMTGPELVEKIEQVRGAIPTIFMSGHTEDEFIRSGTLGDHQRFMQKPFSPAELLSEVRALLESRRPAV